MHCNAEVRTKGGTRCLGSSIGIGPFGRIRQQCRWNEAGARPSKRALSWCLQEAELSSLVDIHVAYKIHKTIPAPFCSQRAGGIGLVTRSPCVSLQVYNVLVRRSVARWVTVGRVNGCGARPQMERRLSCREVVPMPRHFAPGWKSFVDRSPFIRRG